jgi:curved DNA-binding protein CbpA
MPDQEQLKEEIDAKYEEIQGANYYEVLGLERDASTDAIRTQFRDLAKKWHADKYSAAELGEEHKKKLQAIFSEINNAHRALSDPEDRREYNASLDAGAEDIQSVIDAEHAFRQGKNLLDAGRHEGAYKQFERACEMSPEDEPDYRAHRIYTEYLMIPKTDSGEPKDADKARAALKELDAIAQDSDNDKDWLYAHRGMVALGLGRTQKAKHLFREATRLNPDNTMASRQLRLLRMRSDKNQDKGLFGKLLDKIGLGS